MRLLYDYFGADARLPLSVDDAIYTKKIFYKPSGTIHHNIMNPRSYSSRIMDLQEYYTLGDRIQVLHDHNTRNVLMFGPIYDFMAHVSQRIRDATNARRKLQAHRIDFKATLNGITANGAHGHLYMLIRIFHAVIDSIRPPPYTPALHESPLQKPYDRMSVMQYQTESE